MASSHWGEMKEKNSNTINSCRSLFKRASRSTAPKSPLSHFINITITKKSTSLNHHPSPNIRIKIPKLLGKTLKKKDCQSDTSKKKNNSKNSKKWNNPRKLFPSKVASLFTNVFNKKSSVNGGTDTSHRSDDGTSNVSRNVDEHGNRCIDEETQIFSKLELGDSGLFKGSSKSSRNSLNSVELPSLIACTPDFNTLNEILEVEEEEEEKQTELVGKRAEQSIVTHKQPMKVPLSFWRFFNKKTPLNFIKGKTSINGGGGGGGGDREIEKEEDKEGGDKELCRKRILMGERCRRMNFSGMLRYDENEDPLP